MVDIDLHRTSDDRLQGAVHNVQTYAADLDGVELSLPGLGDQMNEENGTETHIEFIEPPPVFNPDKITARLDPDEVKPSLSCAIAYLEQVGPWTTYAFRLGILQLIEGCAKTLAEPDAGPDTVEKLQLLVSALAHLPFDQGPT